MKKVAAENGKVTKAKKPAAAAKKLTTPVKKSVCFIQVSINQCQSASGIVPGVHFTLFQ